MREDEVIFGTARLLTSSSVTSVRRASQSLIMIRGSEGKQSHVAGHIDIEAAISTNGQCSMSVGNCSSHVFSLIYLLRH